MFGLIPAKSTMTAANTSATPEGAVHLQLNGKVGLHVKAFYYKCSLYIVRAYCVCVFVYVYVYVYVYVHVYAYICLWV